MRSNRRTLERTIHDIEHPVDSTPKQQARLRKQVARLERSGDDQDSLDAVITDLIMTDPAACLPTIRAFVRDTDPARRETGRWAMAQALTAETATVGDPTASGPNSE